MQIRFPEFVPELADSAHRYYLTHFAFVLGILRENGCLIEFFRPNVDNSMAQTWFQTWINGRTILWDVSDYQNTLTAEEVRSADAIFKFHYSASYCRDYSNVFPFSPISFYDWGQYQILSEKISYQGRGSILNNQKPHTQNWQRRVQVRELLRKHYGVEVDSSFTSQVEFWTKINHALVSVCVPGARIDILDRGQLQYMAFGACTISPKLYIELPFGESLLPNVHYLECAADWSDLVQKIEWARCHSDTCVRIGESAKALFRKTMTAHALFRWIDHCLDAPTTRGSDDLAPQHGQISANHSEGATGKITYCPNN